MVASVAKDRLFLDFFREYDHIRVFKSGRIKHSYDKLNRNRAEGTSHWKSTFTDRQIRAIRRSRASHRNLADKYKVRLDIIHNICSYKTYASVA